MASRIASSSTCDTKGGRGEEDDTADAVVNAALAVA
jgi:hypothetical protein